MHTSIKGLLIVPYLIIKMPVCVGHGWIESSHRKPVKQLAPTQIHS